MDVDQRPVLGMRGDEAVDAGRDMRAWWQSGPEPERRQRGRQVGELVPIDEQVEVARAALESLELRIALPRAVAHAHRLQLLPDAHAETRPAVRPGRAGCLGAGLRACVV